jgi:hypothetical protein
MKARFVAIAAAGVLVVSVSAVSVPASAYDKEAYGYAASHFLNQKQIPKVFKATSNGFFVGISQASAPILVCGFGPNGNTLVKLAKGTISSNAEFGSKAGMTNLSVIVTQYKSNVAAEKSFTSMSKAVKKCDGTVDTSFTSPDGTVFPSSTVTTTGKVPGVTVAGVETVFIDLDSKFAAAGGNPASTSDQRALFTLVNDVIIRSDFNIGTSKNLSAAQKKGLEKVAFDMVDSWLD